MQKLISQYDHSLDAKGRVILPVKFRPFFVQGGYLSQYDEGCIALWPPEDFDRKLEAVQRAAEDGDQRERNLARVLAGSSTEVEIDPKTGRLLIPPFLRNWAQLTTEVLIVGAIDRVELWNPVDRREAIGTIEEEVRSRN